MSKALYAIIFWYPLFAVPVMAGSGLIYIFLKQHIVLTRYHVLSLFLPWFIWVGLGIYDGTHKSVLNLFEAVLLGLFVVVLFLLEGLASANKSKVDYFPPMILGLACLMAVFLWAFTPGLPGY
jgi:hypothetical protein